MFGCLVSFDTVTASLNRQVYPFDGVWTVSRIEKWICAELYRGGLRIRKLALKPNPSLACVGLRFGFKWAPAEWLGADLLSTQTAPPELHGRLAPSPSSHHHAPSIGR